MPFLGVQPTDTFASVAKQTITGDGSVTYTLTHSVANANDLAVFVNNVRQEPTVAYSASGTSITFTEAIASTDDCYVVYIARTFQTVTAPDNSVNADQLSYPLTNFSSTGIDDNATSTAITINSSQNVSLSNDLTVDTNVLKVDTGNNRVGVGTQSPTALLDVAASLNPTIRLKAGLVGNDPSFDDQYMGGVEWFTNDTSGIGAHIGASIRAFSEATGTSTTPSYALIFSTSLANTVESEAMRITRQGNVGIGTSDPSDAGLVIDAKGNANTSASVRFKSNVGTYLRVARFGAGVDSTITLGNNYNRNSGSFAADNSAYPVHNITFNTDGSMRFGTGAAGSSYPTERMRILPSGGITFNGDTAAANALDDYEEGTWTPTYTTSNSQPSVTYNVQNGQYTKIGRCVFVTMYLQVSSVSSIGTGNPRFSGLPFTGTGSNERLAIQTYLVDWDSATWPSDPMAYISNGTSYFRVILWRDNGTWVEPQASQFAVDTANAVVNISGFYFTSQ